LFTVFGGPGIILVLVPWLFIRFRIPSEEPIGLILADGALIAIGLIPLLESIGRFIVVGRASLLPAVPTEHLVVTGPYRFVRSPMYCGVIMAVAAEALLFQSRDLLYYFASPWLGFHLFVYLYEEPRLTDIYADEYRAFQRNVPRWLPRIKPWNPIQKPVRTEIPDGTSTPQHRT
jgi:protein-S-isoprenylcysteine O-methyltransferase Ste14